MTYTITVNGEEFDADVAPDTPLLWVLREHLTRKTGQKEKVPLTGRKYGCGIAMCGACTVHVKQMSPKDPNDPRAPEPQEGPVRSCQVRIDEVDKRKLDVTTIEGVSKKVADAIKSGSQDHKVEKAVLSAWRDFDVVQCGYCQSGQIMTAIALLKGPRAPSEKDFDDAIVNAMDAIVCRCATYYRIRKAIHAAADTLNGSK